jgi:hypothetical protein
MFRSQINPPRCFQRLSASDLATRHSSLATAPLTPFPATLTSHLQPVKNTTTLSPAFATLTRRVKPNSFVCHSYKKHPASNLSSQRSCRSSFPPPNFLPTRHSPLATISFTIRTYEKPASNPFRIRTSKTQDLKPFRMNTSEKTGGGGPLLPAKCTSALAVILRLTSFTGRRPRITGHEPHITLHLAFSAQYALLLVTP